MIADIVCQAWLLSYLVLQARQQKPSGNIKEEEDEEWVDVVDHHHSNNHDDGDEVPHVMPERRNRAPQDDVSLATQEIMLILSLLGFLYAKILHFSDVSQNHYRLLQGILTIMTAFIIRSKVSAKNTAKYNIAHKIGKSLLLSLFLFLFIWWTLVCKTPKPYFLLRTIVWIPQLIKLHERVSTAPGPSPITTYVAIHTAIQLWSVCYRCLVEDPLFPDRDEYELDYLWYTTTAVHICLVICAWLGRGVKRMDNEAKQHNDANPTTVDSSEQQHLPQTPPEPSQQQQQQQQQQPQQTEEWFWMAGYALELGDISKGYISDEHGSDATPIQFPAWFWCLRRAALVVFVVVEGSLLVCVVAFAGLPIVALMCCGLIWLGGFVVLILLVWFCVGAVCACGGAVVLSGLGSKEGEGQGEGQRGWLVWSRLTRPWGDVTIDEVKDDVVVVWLKEALLEKDEVDENVENVVVDESDDLVSTLDAITLEKKRLRQYQRSIFLLGGVTAYTLVSTYYFAHLI